MITGVMIMTIMKITDDDWITKIVTMIIISTIILIMILKKFRNLKNKFSRRALCDKNLGWYNERANFPQTYTLSQQNLHNKLV